MMDDFFLMLSALILALYAGFAWMIITGLRRQENAAKLPDAQLPFVSLLVAARDEARNLPRLLDSFCALNYPTEKFEILLIDDHSTDRTSEIAKSYQEKLPNLHILTPTESKEGLNGKANALDVAIGKSQGEFICITDADCTVNPNWLRGHVSYFENSTGMVGGITALQWQNQQRPVFSRLQSQDWIFLLGTGSAMAMRGRPLSIIGNNMSFRKSAYYDVGGFQQAGFSLTEDFILMHAFNKKGWNIKLVADPDLQAESQPAHSFKKFFNQRKRWAVGGREISPFAKAIIFTSLGGKLLPFFLLPFGQISLTIFAWLFVTFWDTRILNITANRIGCHTHKKHGWLYSIFSGTYTILMLPSYFLSREVEWKGRVYRV